MREHSGRLPSLAAGALGIALAIALSPALAAEFPTGTYAVNGSITLTFDGRGQFRVNDGKTMKVAGSYTIKADQLVLTDKEGPWACTKSAEQSGTYTWKYDNSVLTFARVTDPCTDRVGSLTASPWKRVR